MLRYCVPRYCAIVALALCVKGAPAASPVIPDFIPPETKVLVGIEWRSLIDAPLVRGQLTQVKTALTGMIAKSPFAGFDPFEDLDEIVLATTGAKDNAPTLIVLRGRFDVTRMPDAVRYRGVPVYETQGSADVAAILDGATAIAGPVAQVRAAIDRRGHGAAPAQRLMARAESLRGRYTVWAVGERLEGFQMPSGSPNGLESIDRFEFGARLAQGLQLTGSIHVRTPADAEKIATSLQLLQLMARNQPAADGVKYESHMVNNTLTLSVNIPEEVLEKGVEQQKAALAQAFSQSRARTAPPVLPSLSIVTTDAPAPPVSREAKIVNDETGNTVFVTLPGSR